MLSGLSDIKKWRLLFWNRLDYAFKFGPKIAFMVKCDKQSLSPAYSYFVRRGLKWRCVLFWNAAGHGAQTEPQVSEVGEGTVTRFRVISPSGDWLARDWRMVMDSRMDWAFWTCCSAQGRVICRRHTRQQPVKEPPGRILKFTLIPRFLLLGSLICWSESVLNQDILGINH